MTKNMETYGVGQYCIIRTYSAGVWMGKVEDKSPTEVILSDARRMYFWKCLDDGITLSHIALNGIHADSKIQAPVPGVLLQWIEIIPISSNAKLTFDAQPYAKAE
jgi:hypothetical protein